MPRTLALSSISSRLLAFLQISLFYLVNTFRLPFNPCARCRASKTTIYSLPFVITDLHYRLRRHAACRW